MPQDVDNLLKTDEHTRRLTVVGVAKPVHTTDVEGSGNPVGAY
jgi:hypothetical protein